MHGQQNIRTKFSFSPICTTQKIILYEGSIHVHTHTHIQLILVWLKNISHAYWCEHQKRGSYT